MVKISFIEVTARGNFPIAGKPNLHLWEVTLQTLAKQTFTDFEYIVSDIFYEERKDYFKDHNYGLKIKHVPAAPNIWHGKGLCQICHQFNKGIIHADGELLFFCADSNMLHPNLMENLWNHYRDGWFITLGFGSDVSYGPEYLQTTARENIIPTEWYRFLDFHGHVHMDHRYNSLFEKTNDNFIPLKPKHTNWYYGISTVSLEAALKVNGYNECVPPETLVFGESVKTIEKIEIGDRVLGHDGYLHTVEKIYKRPYNGNLIEIQTAMLHEPVRFTPNHLILSVKPKFIGRNQIICKPYRNKKTLQHYEDRKWVESSKLEVGDYVCLPIPQESWNTDVLYISDWVKEVEVEGSLCYAKQQHTYGKPFKSGRSKPVNNAIHFNADFMRLAGYYLSEGCFVHHPKNTHVDFAFNVNEEEYANDVQSIIEHLFNIKSTIVVRKNVRIVHIYSSTVARFLSAIFSYGAKEKIIPYNFILSPNEKSSELLKGMIRGDGSISLKGKRLRIHYGTASQKLAYSFLLILARFGIMPFFRKTHMKSTFGNHDLYNIIVSGKSATILAELIGYTHPQIKKKNKNIPFIVDGYIYLPITSITVAPYKGEVINLEVEGSKSYTTSFSVHNCFDPDVTLSDIDFGERLFMAGYGNIAMCRDCYAVEAYAGTDWHQGMKPKKEVKCTYGLLLYNRLGRRYRANDPLSAMDVDRIINDVCPNKCDLYEKCRALPRRGSFFNRNELEEYRYWLKHGASIKLDLDFEREMRKQGVDYQIGTFVNC